MKIITIKKKNILKTIVVSVFAVMICKYTTAFGMQHYYNVDFSTGLVTATELNVRSGPGTQYNFIQIHQEQILEVEQQVRKIQLQLL